jgi:hypothetical protein
MQDKIQKQILDAFFVVLRPIAKILLRYGIGFREFAEVAKTAFVDVATREYGIRGRPTNISRVAVMTGLTRKEIRRLRDKIDSGHHSIVVQTTPLATVLHRWHSENEFLDENGRPKKLRFSGGEDSFSALVKRYGGDIPPGAMRTELKRVCAIEEVEDGSLEVVKRSVYPKVDHENLVLALKQSAYSNLATIAYNTDPSRAQDTRPQYVAFTSDVRSEDLSRLRRISRDRIQEFIESFDDLFMAYEKLRDQETDKSESKPVAVCAYYFEESDSKMNTLW